MPQTCDIAPERAIFAPKVAAVAAWAEEAATPTDSIAAGEAFFTFVFGIFMLIRSYLSYQPGSKSLKLAWTVMYSDYEPSLPNNSG